MCTQSQKNVIHMFTITVCSWFSQNKLLQSLTNFIEKIVIIGIIIKYIFILYEICVTYVDIYCYIFIPTLQNLNLTKFKMRSK
jgi:hypothetical protein